MAVDVSSLVRIMKGYKDDQQGMNEPADGGGSGGGKSGGLITRDLLGGCSALDTKELDLDLQVPSGWEKRLDLKSGKVFVQRCLSPNTSSLSSDHKHQCNKTVSKLQDLNFPPPVKQPSMNLLDDTSLDLRIVSPSSIYQSVCTLDKVKSALERAEKEAFKKRSISMSKSLSPCSNSSSSVEEIRMDYEDKSSVSSSSSFAAGCPSCLLYVLISKNNPKCPRCNMIVPSPIARKKPRIDLNIAI